MKKYLELLFLKQLKGFGNVKINKYLPVIEKADSLEILADRIQQYEKKITSEDVDKAMALAKEKCEKFTAQQDLIIITIFDEDYPDRFQVLQEKKPPIIYLKGNKELLSTKNLAVVGTREPSGYSEKLSGGLIKAIVRDSGRCIISGLALGCDKLAHDGAIKNNGSTMAVLPSGVNVITPSSHKNLAKQIIDNGGCLVSEYDPDAKASKFTYVERDKLVASISDAVFVIQCGIKSGTMHTVDAACDFGRKTACFYTEDKTKGDYSGNRFMLDTKSAYKVSNMDELHGFLAVLNNNNESSFTDSAPDGIKQFRIEDFMNLPA